MGRWIIIIGLWLGLFYTSTLQAEEDIQQDPYSVEALAMVNAKLTIAERNLVTWQKNRDIKALEELMLQSTQYEQNAQACITETEKQKAQIDESLKSLGDQQSSEDVALRQKRTELSRQVQVITKRISQCKLISLRASTLQKSARDIIQQDLKDRLFAHQTSLFNSLQSLITNPAQIQTEVKTLATVTNNINIAWGTLRYAFAYGLLGGILGSFWLYYRKRRLAQSKTKTTEVSSPTFYAVWASMMRLMPFILFALFIYLYLSYYSTGQGQKLFEYISLYLFLSLISYSIMRAPLSVGAEIDGFTPLQKAERTPIQFYVKLLAFSGFIYLIISSRLVDLLDSDLINIARTIIGTIIGLAVIALIWRVSRHFILVQRMRLQWLTTITLLVGIGALWFGYRNFSEFLFYGVLGSLFILMLLWLLQHIPNELCDGLDTGKVAWQRQLRQKLDTKEGQLFPGLIWVRLAIAIILNSLALLLLLRLWGVSEQNIILLLNKLLDGIKIGDLTLEPIRLLSGMLAAGLLISFSQFFKKYLSESWLKRTNLSRGARDAMTTISGYIGIILAIVIGLSIAGLKFQNLAIIAGALSVGIGFGLQNVVNNFVSGLILLFERPIRRGDWIRVGTAEGYVKDISIRSTTIQDFDRADIIVPNSELISGRVTNLFLNDSYGRVIIPLRVAYGTHIENLMTLLVNLAKTHNDIINNQVDMRPQALFRSFGESALNFELRFFIRNVELKNQITSQMLVEIEKAFRENGIIIPYPQYVVHPMGGANMAVAPLGNEPAVVP